MELSNPHLSATAYRRQKQIEDCLYENLLHRPYSSVSVSDLCHQLGFSRKSFYNYYPDKDTCFRFIITRKLQSCMLRLADAAANDHARTEAISIFLSFCREEKSFFDIIVRNNLLTFLIDQTIRYLREEDKVVQELLDTPQLKKDPYILSCYVAVNITFVLQWYLQGYATPLEEMVSKYQRLLHQPLITQNKQKETAL